MARVAVLGSTGFAGSAVCRCLREAGHEVTGLSRTSGCDLLDVAAVLRALEAARPDHVVNCAAHVGSVNYVTDFAADVVDDNMRMLLNVYKAVRELRTPIVVNPIANCAYPPNLEDCREDDLWSGPVHPSVLSYGSTRRMMDVLAACYRSQYGVRSVSVIVPNMYGPFDATNPNKTHALNALVLKAVRAAAANEEEFEVWGTGKPVREWLFVEDFARIVRAVVETPFASKPPVNIAQGVGFSVDELVRVVCQVVGYRGRIVKNTKFPDGAPRKVMDPKAFRGRFPDFKFTPIEEGIRRTAAYYRQLV